MNTKPTTTLGLLNDLHETVSWFTPVSAACRRIAAACEQADLKAAFHEVHLALLFTSIDRTERLSSLLFEWMDTASPLLKKPIGKPMNDVELICEVWAALRPQTRSDVIADLMLTAVRTGDLDREAADDYAVQLWHTLGKQDSVIAFFETGSDFPTPTEEECAPILTGWRARGLGWLADYYEPILAARRKTSKH